MERIRVQVEPSKFRNERAKEMYIAGQKVIDTFPPVGQVRWKHLFEGWTNVEADSLQTGQLEEHAQAFAWDTMAMVSSEEMQHLVLMFETQAVEPIAVEGEREALSSWLKLTQNYYNKKFKGKPPEARPIFK